MGVNLTAFASKLTSICLRRLASAWSMPTFLSITEMLNPEERSAPAAMRSGSRRSVCGGPVSVSKWCDGLDGPRTEPQTRRNGEGGLALDSQVQHLALAGRERLIRIERRA